MKDRCSHKAFGRVFSIQKKKKVTIEFVLAEVGYAVLTAQLNHNVQNRARLNIADGPCV